MRMLTTGDCAELLNACFDSPGGFSAAFVLGQIDDAKLHARVNVKAGTRCRRRVRVHPDDLLSYIAHEHADKLERAKHHPLIAA